MRHKVVEVTVQPNMAPVTRNVTKAVPKSVAVKVRAMLEGKNSLADFDPNKLVSYLIQPA